MAISVKTIGRSILESMLFLALFSFGTTILSKLNLFSTGNEAAAIWITMPVLSAFASFVVAFVFPKPTYWRAFLKFFLGALLTVAIFSILLAIIGPTMLSWVLELLWGTGGMIWDWASGNGVAAGVSAVIMYIFFTIFVFGLLFAGLFALTNLMVITGINVFIDKKKEAQDTNRAV